MLKRILLAAALAAFPAAAEASDVVQPSTVSRSATVAGGATRTLELSCRAPAIALNATASGLPAGAAVHRSSPSAGVLGWSLELAAAESAARQRLSASVRCLRLELPAGVRDVSLGAATKARAGHLAPRGRDAPDVRALRARLHPDRLRPRPRCARRCSLAGALATREGLELPARERRAARPPRRA